MQRLCLAGHGLLHELAHLCGGLGDDAASSLESSDLLVGAALAAGDDGTSVTHATARRGGEASDEGHDGLAVRARVVLLEVLGRLLLGRAANLADHDDALGGRILEEDGEAVNEVGAVEGVTADADAQALAQAGVGGLADSLVGEGAGARDDGDAAWVVDVTRHDADLALARLDDARAVGANQARLVLAHKGVLHTDHVLLRDALRDADGERDLSLNRLHDGGSGVRRRHIDDRGRRAGGLLGLRHRGKDRQAEVGLARLAGGDAADHVRAVVDGLLGVEGALLARQALADDLCVAADGQVRTGLLVDVGARVAHGRLGLEHSLADRGCKHGRGGSSWKHRSSARA
eukprot:m.49049 g.49049  ORF g.49049 m.49049 type:complete len:346 (-) comp12788_c0_seq1:3-1040(-)